ncbi:MAG TPA: amidohydrolase family protein [Candidatus Saccharimonadales bacterium]|nr:amidohydrolase family protein [Candidatus Saccharimonadales bacterium]
MTERLFFHVPRPVRGTVLLLLGCALAALFLPPAPALAATADTPAASEGDVEAARTLFERNLDAIRQRDRDAYLSCYLQSPDLARVGPEGPVLGYDALVSVSTDQNWPDLFEALDLRLVPVQPGVVFGTYRYRVAYGPREMSGLSERLFVKTDDGWKIAVTSAFPAPQGTPPPARALTGATLIDGTGSPPVPNAVVVLRAGRIECAGTAAQCPVPGDVEKTDLTGFWITPGLIDAHVHFSQTGWADGRPDFADLRKRFPYEEAMAGLEAHPERFFQSYLCSGVTGVFDVGGYPWTLRLPGRAETDTRAPHVVAAGPLLSTLDHWLNLPAERQFIYLKDAGSASEGVEYLKAFGSSAVKVWFVSNPDRSFEEMASVVMAAGEAAKAAGLPLIVHATGLREAKVALKAGARVLVHSVMDEEVDDEFIDLARRNAAIYCPTLTVVDGYRKLREAMASKTAVTVDDPLACIDPELRSKLLLTASLGPEYLHSRPGASPPPAENPVLAVNLMKVHDAGIPIAMGTDAGNPLTLPGVSAVAEMEAMQKAGLSPMDVIVASTRGSAEAMGRLDDLGTVERGKLADLLVLQADPLETVSNFRALVLVVRGGVVHLQHEFAAPLSPPAE